MRRLTSRSSTLLPILLAIVLAASGAPIATAQTASQGKASFALVDVRIFDGEKIIPNGSVVVADGKIAAVGSDIEIPEGVKTYRAKGGTVIPGLMDGHVHTWGNALVRALVFGVTTEFDQFTNAEMAAGLRAEQANGEADGRADLFSAGTLATAPGGHGTQFGMAIPTLDGPDDAADWVAGRVAEGSDWIKIVAEDGSAYGAEIPSLSDETIAAVIDAAHDHDKLALVHVSVMERARQAIANGADGLVHIFGDELADDEFVRLMAEKGAFVVPTLTVIESTTGASSGKSLVEDEHFKNSLRRPEIATLEQSFPARESTRDALGNAKANIAKLHAAGVTVIAGSDAPNPGTAHGPSLHRELELLVDAALTPVEALRAATADAARAFGLSDRGRIAPGQRADLVLVAGDPTTDILETRDIVSIWKGGVAADRPTVDPAKRALKPDGPQLPESGLLSDFESGDLDVTMGAGWIDSTDQMAGGKSTVINRVVERTDAENPDNKNALSIRGSVNEGFMAPWAGALVSPGELTFQATDLRQNAILSFSARGNEGSYRVLVFSEARGQMPSEKTFDVTGAWKRYEMPLTEFPGIDASDIMGIFFGSGGSIGDFELMIDDVALLPTPSESSE